MCLSPVRVPGPDRSYRYFPCNHCSQCLRAYQDSWTARLNEEVKAWKKVKQGVVEVPPVIFFTLDYAPKHVPCTYIVVGEFGVYTTSERPKLKKKNILEFWTDIRRETPREWLSRRRKMLARYYRTVRHVRARLLCEDYKITSSGAMYRLSVASSSEPVAIGRGSSLEPELFPEPSLKHGPVDVWSFVGQAPKIPFMHHGCEDIDYIDWPWKVPQDYTGRGRPILALELHEVSKPDVQALMKRARAAASYNQPNIFGLDVNPRMKRTWTDVDGNEHEYPSCNYTSTFKYFLTSEYGPRTHRPHYHGVMFGLTYDEFERYVASDWQSRGYGRVKFSVLRPTGGAMCYLAKYCSKGHYEHPLCCRNFIYDEHKDGHVSEYHSRHYELSIDTFGIDAALVKPTFHLVSKGLGAAYAFGAEIQRSFGVQLSELLTPSGNLKYVCLDSDLVKHHRPSFALESLVFHVDVSALSGSGNDVDVREIDADNPVHHVTEVTARSDGSFLVRRYDSGNRVVGESLIEANSVVDICLEQALANLQYSRTYLKRLNNDKRITVTRWHLMGLPSEKVVTGTSALPLPRYYRQWLVSPLASLLRQSAAARLYPSIDALRRSLLQSGRPEDEVSRLVERITLDKETRNALTSERLRKSAKDFYFSGPRYESLE